MGSAACLHDGGGIIHSGLLPDSLTEQYSSSFAYPDELERENEY